MGGEGIHVNTCMSIMQTDGQRLGPVGLQVLRALLALGAGLLLVTAWLLPGRGPSSLSAPPAPTVTPQSCSGMWCRPHRDQRACIHSAALAWPWDTYPTLEFIGMRRTQSCFGEPDFDGPKEVVHRCTGPVVFNTDHPVYQQEGSDEADTGGFCCVHIATVNVAVTDVVFRLDDYSFLISDLKLGDCHIGWEQMSRLAQSGNGTVRRPNHGQLHLPLRPTTRLLPLRRARGTRAG